MFQNSKKVYNTKKYRISIKINLLYLLVIEIILCIFLLNYYDLIKRVIKILIKNMLTQKH